ncbi:AfsR/SARP family transcriptional regulator [Herbidospora sp. NBRC 101105]|uniref:AfsR/SARP family transcriptional regulator n=1 Tax=Herbidospora sp. NBRC 101105 TaxID=3032195 RepID=UPI0024A3BEC1|nr:AfsR/SARP family transcriptional regulator [Herbidospora sp. NBRC 101105]GLX93780.1 SARP family transcriptional regulator [Herbidospora sp. NBRC 101105]
MSVVVGVLGPVEAWDAAGAAIALRGPRHREVLARLVAAGGRVVPVEVLAADLWDDPPEGAVAAIRTFVAALRRALEPGRPPRTPPRVIVTAGPGYAVRAEADVWRFEEAARTGGPPSVVLARLDAALGLWRGPAYAGMAWAEGERARLAEVRLRVVERRAQALLELGRAAEAVLDLDAHARAHPWREEMWRLLALALYRSGRQADALAALRAARAELAGRLGLDPGPGLRHLEEAILRHDDRLAFGDAAARVWASAAAAHDRVAPGAGPRLEAAVGLMRGLAVTGGEGLVAAREHRAAAVEAAEELGDAELVARVIGAYDVPAIWTRSDDPAQAARVVGAAARTLDRLAAGAAPATRARLLATIAVESRGGGSGRARAAAAEAVEIARGLEDPVLLVFALNGAYMQEFGRTGLSGRRARIGAEIVEVAARHGLANYEILGRLIGLQSVCAVGDFAGADGQAARLDVLAVRHDRPLTSVFTAWYRALRRAEDPAAAFAAKEAAYREAAGLLEGAGMPGLSEGLPALASLCLRLRHGRAPEPADPGVYGPFEPWVRPVLRPDADLGAVPDPPGDLLAEALWTLLATAARARGDGVVFDRAREALRPAAGELAGAGSGLVSLGWVRDVIG